MLIACQKAFGACLFSPPESPCLTFSVSDGVIGDLRRFLREKPAGFTRSKLKLLEKVDKESAAILKAIQNAHSFGDLLPGSVESPDHEMPVAKSAGEVEWESATRQASLVCSFFRT